MTQDQVKGPEARASGRGYQQLRAGQEAHQLALAAFRATEQLQTERRWLANQLVRSAVSVAANIAEGYHRGSSREYLQFLTIARGSLAEREYYLIFAEDTDLLSKNQVQELGELVSNAGSLLQGLIRALQAKEEPRRRRRINEAPATYLTTVAEVAESQDPSPEPPPEGP